MAYLAVDKNGNEYIYEEEPERVETCWTVWFKHITGEPLNTVRLPHGSIKKLIGRELTWEDDCVELKEE